MKTQRLGRSSLEVSRLAYGCMRLTGGVWRRDAVDDAAIQRGIGMVEAAFEAGYTFFDHADVYGDTMCETIFGRALALHPEWRERMVIATKCGIRWADVPNEGDPYRYDFSREHILRSVEGSLQRLGIKTIDLLQLHRPDYLADPEDVARAFVELREAGKVREFGVSNFRPSLLLAVQSYLPFPLQVNQVEIHLGQLDAFTDGTLDQCLELRLTPLAWSPLDRGQLADGAEPDALDPHQARRIKLLQALDAAAQARGVSRAVMALAWLLRHPGGIIPIVGSADPAHIRAAARADDLEVDRETWYRLLEAAVGQRIR